MTNEMLEEYTRLKIEEVKMAYGNMNRFNNDSLLGRLKKAFKGQL